MIFFFFLLCAFMCFLLSFGNKHALPLEYNVKENRDPQGTPPHGFPQRTIYYGFSRAMVAAVNRLPSRGLHLPGTPGLGGPHGPRGAPPAARPRYLQVKELGAIIYNCSRLAQDLKKTFQTYWVLGVPRAVLPKPWPRNFSSHINCFQPFQDYFDRVPTTAYFSVRVVRGADWSPCSPGWPEAQGAPESARSSGPRLGEPAPWMAEGQARPQERTRSSSFTGDRQPECLWGSPCGPGGLRAHCWMGSDSGPGRVGGGPVHHAILSLWGEERGTEGRAVMPTSHDPPQGTWQRPQCWATVETLPRRQGRFPRCGDPG